MPKRNTVFPLVVGKHHSVVDASNTADVIGQGVTVQNDPPVLIGGRRVVEGFHGPLLEPFGADNPDHSISQAGVRSSELQGESEGGEKRQEADGSPSVSPEVEPACEQYQQGKEHADAIEVVDEQCDSDRHRRNDDEHRP
jgi:hypothetical protein